MPKLKFTVTTVAHKTPPTDKNETIYFDEVTKGLAIAVTRNGRKTWIARYRFDGRQVRHKIGPVDAIPLADARDRMLNVRHDLSKDIEPSEKRKNTKDKRINAREHKTVEAVSKRYLAACEKGTHKYNARHSLRVKSMATHKLSDRYVRERTKGMLMTDMTRQNLQNLVEDI